MKVFLKSMVNVKKEVDVSKSYQKAYTTISPKFTGNLTPSQKKVLNELIQTFDKIEKVNYANIPEKLTSDKWIYDKRNYDGKSIEISLIRNKDNKWIFSKETIDSLNYYPDYFINKKYVEGVEKLTTVSDKIKSLYPASFQKEFLFLYIWQWCSIFIYIFMAYILEVVSKIVVKFILNSKFNFFKNHSKDIMEGLLTPIGKLAFFSTLIFGLGYLDFRVGTFNFFSKALLIVTTICVMWIARKVIGVISLSFLEKSQETESKFDDILVPLIAKTAYVLLYCITGLIIASHLEIDVRGIVAGLGIGGLAFAFAAKDTLANFFGSIMLVLDRPFDIGDVITAGDVEGVVMEVGFRSTRIRTFYDSIITISNGALVGRSIDNKGKRRYRRLTTTLGLEYSTSPKRVEAFCEGIRQLIINHKWTRKDNFHVYFTNFGASSLDINLTVYWETNDYSREQMEKHRLMIDILRLANEMKINFAFPTQTLHLFNEDSTEQPQDKDMYLDEGIDTAKNLIKHSISLKNPRSNANEKDQFGNNDIGNG
jgi:MscS family membrane protein